MRSLEQVVGDYLVRPVSKEVHDAESFQDDWYRWMVMYGAAEAITPVGAMRLDGKLMTYLDREATLRVYLQSPEKRRELGEKDPLMFALIYLRKAMTSKNGVTFSDLHFHAFRDAYTWRFTLDELQEMHADNAPWPMLCVAAPRESGKTHLYAKILAMWAAAYGYFKYMIFGSDRAGEGSVHIRWWKAYLKSPLIMTDFPELSELIVDNKNELATKSGFRMETRGVDGAIRGAIDVDDRPDYIMCDDINAKEPGDIPARRDVMTKSVPYLGYGARVRVAGTNTMPDNIIDDLLADIFGKKKKTWTTPWDVLYIAPTGKWRVGPQGKMLENWPVARCPVPTTGDRRSWWPMFRAFEYAIDGVRSLEYREQFDPGWYTEMVNQSILQKGGLYKREYYRRIESTDPKVDKSWVADKLWIEVDPAYTIADDSDETGLAICGLRWGKKDDFITGLGAPDGGNQLGILHSEGVRLLQFDLMDYLQSLIDTAPWHSKPQAIFIENNGMGDNWLQAGSGLSVPVFVFPAIKMKERRLMDAAQHYRFGRVVHYGHMSCEDQQLSYDGPDSLPHVDQMDVVANAIMRAFQPEMLGYARDVPKGTVSIGG